ncbi:cell division cycle protein 23 homolog [Drosophila pseudoobscura]|uniref:Cyclosome subunit 8 n=1 Tax=Drosophila pseudoobscura pseudoobscura TaxID=46245 RepID=Q29KS5_DROPS|nr:cell division cycle protein 23 homolog [Drosophila pseudoobscura]
MQEFFSVLLPEVKKELRRGIIECSKRGLLHSTKWLAEMHHGLSDVQIDNEAPDDDHTFSQCQLEGIAPAEYSDYFLAKSYYDVREYDRAAHAVRNCESSVPRFLHFYSTYLAREKRRLDSTTDQANLNEPNQMRDLADLLSTLRAEYGKSRLDGYGIYLYGVVLKALDLNQAAEQMLVHAIRLVPMLWSAYLELSPLIMEKKKLLGLQLGGHWMRHFFMAHTYLELYLNDDGLKIYEDLQTSGFSKSIYLIAQMALVYHNKRDVDKAIELYQALLESDPYRLDNVDTYSNLLFVKEMKTEMAQLAHKAVSINKYRPETCCVIGNYYSIRCDHQVAISYFQRALKLNPKYLAAWTLMGHEFMELKNTNAAIQSYRKAVEVNKRDYRAWYGLGQAYEIIKMHYYSLYYFKIAHQLRPYDSRMLVALGETYEKLDKCENAVKCYWKAIDVGDIEGIAMYKLASLHEKLGDHETAVHCYIMYCEDERAATDKQSLYQGFITLANYYEKKGDYERAAYYAYKCLDSDERKAEAKALLKTIDWKRSAEWQKKSKTPSAVATAETSSEEGEEEDMEWEQPDMRIRVPFTSIATKTTSTTTATAAATAGSSGASSTLRAGQSLSEGMRRSQSSRASLTPAASSTTTTTATVTTPVVDETPGTSNRAANPTDPPPSDEASSMDISSVSID